MSRAEILGLRYTLRYEVKDSTVTSSLVKPLIWGGVAHIDIDSQPVHAGHFKLCMLTSVKLRWAVEAARYWKMQCRLRKIPMWANLAVAVGLTPFLFAAIRRQGEKS